MKEIKIISAGADEKNALEMQRGNTELATKVLGMVIDYFQEQKSTVEDLTAFIEKDFAALLELQDLNDEFFSFFGSDVPSIHTKLQDLFEEVPVEVLPKNEEISAAFEATWESDPEDPPTWWMVRDCINVAPVPPELLQLIAFDDSHEVDVDRFLRRFKALGLRPATPTEAIPFDLAYRSGFHDYLEIVVLGVLRQSHIGVKPLCLSWEPEPENEEVLDPVLEGEDDSESGPLHRAYYFREPSHWVSTESDNGAPLTAYLVAPL